MVLVVAALSLAGCGSSSVVSSRRTSTPLITGQVHGGQQPVTGASVQLYAVGSTGDGSAATPLLTTPVTTDTSGNFNITNDYPCTPGTQVYLVALGGNPGLSASTNPQIALLAMLGDCSLLTPSTYITVNEVTTVDAASALVGFANSYSAIGSGSSDASSLVAAVNVFNQLVNPSTGTAPGPALPNGFYGANLESNTLANALAACVNSAGGHAGDSSPCGNLFSYATPSGGPAPTDTFAAAREIAANPSANTTALFNLALSDVPFQPTLAAAPATFLLQPIPYAPTPSISPAGGTYTSGQTVDVLITSSMPQASLYYTTDGSTPTTSSAVYSAPIPISASTTVRVIAAQSGYEGSAAAGATYTFTPSSSSAPLFSPAPGSYGSAQTVSIVSPTPGASIFYTTDGSTPTSASTAYSGPIPVAASQTINAIAVAQGGSISPVVSAPYTILWSSYLAFGDSITSCCAPSIPANLYVNRLGNVLNLTVQNLGVHGAQASDVAYEIFGNANPGDKGNPLQTLLIGTNDANDNGVGAHEPVFQFFHQAEIAWLASSSSSKVTGASFATPPAGWSFDNTFSQAYPLTGLQSTTQGSASSWTVTTTGGPIAIWYRVFDYVGGAFTYAIDGGTPVAVSTQPYSFSTYTSPQHYDSVGATFASVAAGAHQVTITVTSPTSPGNNLVSILALGTSPPSSSTNPPLVYVGGTPYQLNDQNSAATAAYNADALADVNQMNSMGFHAVFVDVRQFMKGAPSEMSDQLHPNDLGHLELEEAFKSAITENSGVGVTLAIRHPGSPAL